MKNKCGRSASCDTTAHTSNVGARSQPDAKVRCSLPMENTSALTVMLFMKMAVSTSLVLSESDAPRKAKDRIGRRRNWLESAHTLTFNKRST